MKKTSYQVLVEKYNKLCEKYNTLCEIVYTLDYDKNSKADIKNALLSALYMISKK